jgi:hypothetical protein
MGLLFYAFGIFLSLQSCSGRKATMVISDRLRQLREDKKLSQGDIEKRTGPALLYFTRRERAHGARD